ncbi:MAG: QueT transporter family protein [Lachnospiraceae bacterium]
MNKKALYLTQGAMIAAIYVVLTIVFSPISYGAVQVRISEMLTILPFFTPAAIPGVFLGCLISGIMNGAILPDIIFGSLATLAAAFATYALRRHKWLAPVPPIVVNMLAVPFILYYGYGVGIPIPLLALSVGAGQLISCGLLGMVLLHILDRYKVVIFRYAGE